MLYSCFLFNEMKVVSALRTFNGIIEVVEAVVRVPGYVHQKDSLDNPYI